MRSAFTKIGPAALGRIKSAGLSRIVPAGLSLAGQYVIRALFRTLRVKRTGQHILAGPGEGRSPVIFVFWHGRLLPLIHVHRHQGTVVLVSEHRDGEYLARLLHHFGFGTARGSSTRGGVRGLRGLLRAAHTGHDLAITPDGPRGPNRQLKPGALTVARMTGLPLVPVAVGVTSAWRIRSWDGLLVPKPFSTVRVAYGSPTLIPRDANHAEIDEVAASLQQRLGDLSDQVGDTAHLGQVDDTGPLTEAADAEPSGLLGETGPS